MNKKSDPTEGQNSNTPMDSQTTLPARQPAEGGLSSSVLLAVVGTESEVCRDIERRQQIGMAKYGTTVAENPLPLREWLQHAYEETLDKAIYLKRAIAEIDSANAIGEARREGRRPRLET